MLPRGEGGGGLWLHSTTHLLARCFTNQIPNMDQGACPPFLLSLMGNHIGWRHDKMYRMYACVTHPHHCHRGAILAALRFPGHAGGGGGGVRWFPVDGWMDGEPILRGAAEKPLCMHTHVHTYAAGEKRKGGGGGRVCSPRPRAPKLNEAIGSWGDGLDMLHGAATRRALVVIQGPRV